MSDALWRWGAVQLSRAIAAREISPVDLMRATLARIDAVNPTVNAIVALQDREALMGAARAAEAVAPNGWLHGIPMALKDLVEVKGVASTSGSPIYADHMPVADDAMARRLKGAGAIVIGKTNVPEFGLGSHTRNPVFGATRNPHALDRSAGGSSGGAAGALATGMVSVADGSDMMGSLRNPAAWCDVWGFRPSVGRITGDVGDKVLLHRLSTAGPMARNLEDLAALLDTQIGAPMSPRPVPEAPRIGWLGDWGGAYAMEPGLLAAGEAALTRAEALGWRIEALGPPMEAGALWESWVDLRAFAWAQELAPLYAAQDTRALLNPQAIWETERGLSVTGEDVARASAIRRDWLAQLEQLFTQFDALVLPSTQLWPFPVDWDWPREVGGRATDTYHRWMECVVPASLAGLPALALPGGFGETGLPHGLQLIGAAGADAQILSLGRAWEDMIGPRAIRDPG